VVISRVLTVEIWLHASNFLQITHFFCVSPGKKTLAHGETKTSIFQLMPLSQGLLLILWWGSITHFACQDFASRIKTSQFTHFFCVFLGKRPLHRMKQKHRYGQFISVS
jgi:hypothetical protein